MPILWQRPSETLFLRGRQGTHLQQECCDSVALGSPIYFDTVSAQVKLMIDRSNCLMPYTKHPDGRFGFVRRMKKEKNGVLIAVSGIEQEFETILAIVK